MAKGITGKASQAMATERPDPMGPATQRAGTGQLFQTLREGKVLPQNSMSLQIEFSKTEGLACGSLALAT